MRYAPGLLDEIRARIAVSDVVGRKVALKKKGREFAGLSPFKTEKTASFFVNDQKGFYHCFASGEHGDIFTFLMKTEGLSFPEAVERLAEEAGVALPKPDARDEQREEEKSRLYRLLEASAEFFAGHLGSGPDGRAAREYLDRRGLSSATIGEFRLGFAPNSRNALKDYLSSKGFSAQDMAVSGMQIAGEDIPQPYDRFRNRVMFPITDPKGRVIAFGGRALDPDQPAKYLNSPETPLFHKGHVLFNAGPARAAAFKSGRVIAVEGYMDVIALTQAGFREAVAPLGTALTADQIQLLWRMAPEPILCFDGDTAGQKAAHRAVDTVLPHLKPGNSLTFAFLPDGLDPDDLIRQSGNEAMASVLDGARPLADVLFDRELASGDWTTPERRAQLELQTQALVAKIADERVRSQYEREMRSRLFNAWGAQQRKSRDGRDGGRGRYGGGAGARSTDWAARPRNNERWGGGKRGNGSQLRNFAGGEGAIAPSQALKRSRLVSAGAAAPPARESLLLMALLNHPWLLDADCEEVSRLEFTSSALTKLRDAVLLAHSSDISLDRAGLRSQLERLNAGELVLMVERSMTHRCDKFAQPDSDANEVEAGWRHALDLHDRQLGLRKSLEAAERAWHEDGTEAALARICELQSELARFDHSDRNDA